MSIVSELQKLFEVPFIQEVLFELIEEKEKYSPLLVVNHQDEFLTLSNEDFYLIVLPVTSADLIKSVKEHASYIFNRKMRFVQLENHKTDKLLKDFIQISISDIINQAEYNGIDENNIFLKLLQDIPDSAKTFN